jgi:uncharacterized membrane protein YjfL (UPF0719 family)
MEIAGLINWMAESAIYSILWILIMVICFIVIDKLTNFSLKKELIEDENIALWTMFAGFFIAVAIIIAASIV